MSHEAHNVSRFSILVLPPSDHGTTWSTCRSAAGGSAGCSPTPRIFRGAFPHAGACPLRDPKPIAVRVGVDLDDDLPDGGARCLAAAVRLHRDQAGRFQLGERAREVWLRAAGPPRPG